MENTYQNPPAAPSNTPPSGDSGSEPENVQATYVKATPPNQRKSSMGKTILAIIGLIAFFGIGLAGVLISQRQYVSEGPVAPNVPESQPEAAIEQASCTLTFTVPSPTPTPEPNECGYTPCETDNECEGDLVCITADDGENYCSVEEYEEACAENPSVTTCCEEPTPTPTPTPEPLSCGESGCEDNFDCGTGLICIVADNGNNYCGEPDYKSACADNPSETSCCTAPTSTPTPTPSITPTGEQPDLPDELPQSGPENWLRYLQAGLATLGVGALLLLLL